MESWIDERGETKPSTPRLSSFVYRLSPFSGGYRSQPIAIFVGLAGDAVEERLLQLFRDRAALAAADGAVVELADRRHLRGGAGEESLVGAVDLVAGDALGHEGDAEILRDTDHRVARDALEGGGELGLVERAVLHQEDVLAGALRDEAVHVEQRSEEHTSELQSLAYLVCR